MGHTQISVDTLKIAEIVLNGENYVKKVNNTIQYLGDEMGKLKASSPQIDNFRQMMKKEFADIAEIKKQIAKMSEALAAYRKKIESMEGSDQIWAQARASLSKANTNTQVKVK